MLGKSSQQQHRRQKKKKKKIKSHQTKDTSQDRVQSEVTVIIESEKEHVGHGKEAQAKWRRESKEGKTKEELDT